MLVGMEVADGNDQQYLQEIIGLLVGLGQEAQRECRHGVVAPGAKQSYEKGLPILQDQQESASGTMGTRISADLCFEIAKPFA